jgi:hypothetical protein
MEPVPITPEMADDLVDAAIISYGAPDGLEDKVHAIKGLFELGVPHRWDPDRIYLPFRPDEAEMAALLRGDPVWLVLSSHRMPVVLMHVGPLPGFPDIALRGGPHDGLWVARTEVRAATGLQPELLIGGLDNRYVLHGDSYVWAGDEPAPEKED